jgi:hypothetical protein
MHFCCNGVRGDIYALTTMKLKAKKKKDYGSGARRIEAFCCQHEQEGAHSKREHLYFLPSDGSKACQLAWLATTAIIPRKRINSVEKQISATIDTVSHRGTN